MTIATTIKFGDHLIVTDEGAGIVRVDSDTDGGGGSTGVDWPVTQIAHGLVVGDIVRLSGSSYIKAQANNDANAEVVGIVQEVADADNFTLAVIGHVDGLSGLTAGVAYYLSDTTAGALTATEPTAGGSISKPLLIADGASSGFFFNWRGAMVGVAPPTVLDDFERASLGTNWTSPALSGDTGVPFIDTGIAIPTAVGGTAGSMYWNPTTFPADSTITTIYKQTATPTSGRFLYVLLACAAVDPSALTGYLGSIEWFGGTASYAIYRANAGTFTPELGRSATFIPADGDVFELEKSGAAFVVKRNGTTILTLTDPAPLSADGYVGMGGSSQFAGWDSFDIA